MVLVLDGGIGNDVLYVASGEKGVTIGGTGRDWIFNTSPGGIIWGDAENGIDELGNPVVYSDKSNSDKIWWSPDTSVMDASQNDFLAFYGMPLTGGNSMVPLITQGVAAFFGGIATAQIAAHKAAQATGHTLFFDNLIPGINYIAWRNAETGDVDLYVANGFTNLNNYTANKAAGGGDDFRFLQTGDGRSLLGAMRIDSISAPVGAFGMLFPLIEGGDFGFKFKVTNPMAAFSLVPGIAGVGGAYTDSYLLADELIVLANSTVRYVKAMNWATEGDPLVLDLDDDGIEIKNIDKGQIWFDFNNNFFAEKTAWLGADDSFLVVDANVNGRITAAANDNATQLKIAA